jgi:conjugal transfer pilus assembly protein TraV
MKRFDCWRPLGRGLTATLTLTLAGCAGTMSGLDGQGKFSCKAPDGISCASLSGVYANAVQNNLPGQAQPAAKGAGGASPTPITRPVLSAGDPIRSGQTLRRVWFAPWEDEDEVLHDQAYVYLVVDPGRWQVEHSRRQASDAYRPVTPPRAFTPAASNPGERPTLRMERTGSQPQASPSQPLQGSNLVAPAAENER